MFKIKMLTLSIALSLLTSSPNFMAKNINSKPFDEGTLLKLDIFRKCFREWYPVFVHDPFTKYVCVFDMFAGSGYDSAKNQGSPIILLDEARGFNRCHCKRIQSPGYTKQIYFCFNELKKKKFTEFQENAKQFLITCQFENHCASCPILSNLKLYNKPFQSLISSPVINNILQRNDTGKFVLMDQYGVKEVTEDIFKMLVSSPKTDFIFFISSQTIKRFQEMDAIKNYFDVNKIDFDNSRPEECHRIIKEYFENFIPSGKEYYLHSFTIQKVSNYYGLIFGTSHSLGMEKFLKACWDEDPLSGDSNCNIDNDYEVGSLFYDESQSSRKVKMKQDLREKILAGKIKNNAVGLKYTLKNGCLPTLFVEVAKELKQEGKITIKGTFSESAANIHKIKPGSKGYYEIETV